MDDESDLRRLLHRPLPVSRLDVARTLELAESALRRRRRRRSAGLALVAAAAVGGITAGWPAPADERLQPAEQGRGGLALSIVSATVTPPVPGLTVTAPAHPLLLGQKTTGLALTWTSDAEHRVPDGPDVRVRARDGRQVLQLAGPRCPPEVACAPRLPHSRVDAGTPRRTALALDPQAPAPGPGDYDLRLPLPDTASTLAVTLRVAPAPEPASTAPAVTVSGTITSTDPARPLTMTPHAPSGVAFANTRTGEVVTVQSADGTFTTRLSPGTYEVTAATYSGHCPPQTVTVDAPAPPPVSISCSP